MNWYADGDLDWSLTWFGFDGSNAVDPYGPAGLATFVLDLENGYKVKHRWARLDVHKFRSGAERRIQPNDAPQESYDGAAVLLGDAPRNTRATLARYASQTGAAFLLALPHEGISIVSVSGSTVTVGTTGKSDWTKPGQRVVAVWIDDDDVTQYVEATIQEVTATTIELDASPNADSYAVMPLRPIFLEPQQTFARYPVEAEVWQLAARAAIFDFAPALAELDIGIAHPSMAGNVVQAREFGSAGNRSFQLLVSPGNPATGALVETATLTKVLAQTNVTTMDDVNTLFTSSPYVRFKEFTPAYVIQSGDSFTGALTGGATAGTQGAGETLTEYAGDGVSRPVWDRRLVVATTAADSIQAMTQIIDHGGVSYSVGTADASDWGRVISFISEDWFDWQWLKLFFATTLGPQKAFWLPTWRDDMDLVSYAPIDVNVSELVVEVDDLGAWWPALREHIQCVNADGSVAYTHIQDATNNGDGTWTLTVEANDDIDDVRQISWLELCRFESDEFEFSFGEHGIELQTIARAVQQ